MLRIAAVGIAAATVVTLAAVATRGRAERNEVTAIATTLHALLAGNGYDNRPETDRLLARDPLLGSTAPVPVFRARLDGQPVAAVVTTIAPRGFVGPIRLLVAIRADGSMLGVDVLEHHETPGIGDRIDPDKTRWLDTFAGHTAAEAEPAFDALTGATVTSRAVVDAVNGALRYFEAHRAEIFAPAPP